MGKGWEGIAASSRGSKGKWFRSCQTHHVCISPQEDRRRSKSEVGEGEGAAEEGGVGQTGSFGRQA
jgi:hypothetical protein